MMSYDFQTITHGKWILAGEHAVLRGHPALVFPIQNKTLTLTYYRTHMPLRAVCQGEQEADIQAVLWRTLEQGMALLNVSLNQVNGQLVLQNQIPVGSGMGASAALCVAVARWFVFIGALQTQKQLDFAKELEHIFHGKSSGVDIAGAASTTGVYFQQGIHKPVLQTWQPQWYLSSCGEAGLTAQCIQQVQSLWQNNSNLAQAIDQTMHESVTLAALALQEPTSSSQQQLAEAINMASSCFAQWGLISECLDIHMQQLRQHGAIAVKPTGSGGGGHVVSLWNEEPPQSFQLIKV